jgi:MFS family permease
LGLTQAEVGYLWTWNGILVVLIQIPVAHWISRYRSSSSLAAGSLMYALGWGMVGLAGAWALDAPYVFLFLLINMTIVTMGEIVVSPASMNLVATMSPDSERGRYMGVYGLASSIGFAAGPFAGGLILDGFWHQDVLLWALIGAFGIIAAIGFISLGHRLSSKTNSATGKG